MVGTYSISKGDLDRMIKKVSVLSARIAELERSEAELAGRVVGLELSLGMSERERDRAQGRVEELEALAKLFAKPVIDKDGVLWIGDGVGYVPARAKEKDR